MSNDKKSEPKTDVPNKLVISKPTKPTKPEKSYANGIVRPYADTKCGAIWTVADELSKMSQRPATKDEVLEECTKLGYNLGNAKDEFSRWRRYNGLTKKAVKTNI